MALSNDDLFLVNDSQDGNKAKKIKYSTLKSDIETDVGVSDLQAVTDAGNTTTNNIVINDKITLQSNGTINGESANIGKLTFNSQKISTNGTALVLQPPADKDILFKTGATNSLYKFFKSDESARADLRFSQLTANRSYTFPDEGGTIALTSDIPTVPPPVVPGDGALTIQTAGEGASATGTFTANQSAGSTITLPTIRYEDISGTPTIPTPVTYTAGDGLDLAGTEFAVDNTVVRTSGNQTVGGTKTFSQRVNIAKALKRNGVGSIPDNSTSWDLLTSNFWVTSAATILNPSNISAGMSGLIFCTAEVTAWGDSFNWPGGAAPEVPANSVVPYYVKADDEIIAGLPTKEYA